MTHTNARLLSFGLLALSLAGGCARSTMIEAPRGDAGQALGDAGPHFTGADAGPALADAYVAPAVDAGPPAVDAARPPVDCTPSAPVCDRSVYDRARAFAAAHPEDDGHTWDQHCGALMFQFGGFSRSANTAAIARSESTIVSTNPAAAPVGAFHWWDIGTAGHVGVDILGGGTTVFMASAHLGEVWGDAIGVQSIPTYNAESGARYRGWSMDYVGQHLAGGGSAACTPAAIPAGCPIPASATATSGVPDSYFWMRMQMYAAEHGYTGPIDGVMGTASWAGIQRAMAGFGYTGPVDGVPGVNTYKAMQRLAAAHGYTGPIDGVLGPNSYEGLARFLNTL